MDDHVLRHGDSGEEVAALQRSLNKIGALLNVDGDFGPATERAVREAQEMAGLPQSGEADAKLRTWLEAQPEPSPLLPSEGVVFLAREECGGRAHYDRFAARPHWPGEASGVTIGIGYDLRFQGDNFEQDWGDVLPDEVRRQLKPWCGRVPDATGLSALGAITVPFPVAWHVFARSTLPRFVEQARRTFPGFDDLPWQCQAALVSLVFNRGASLRGASRREMAAIREHIARGELDKVPQEFLAMRRLWPSSPGLRARRAREAELWRAGLAAARTAMPLRSA